MRLTEKVLQTTIAYLLTTVVGFLGTLYFARTLGPGPIGTFALGVSIVVWGTVFDFGFGIAGVKRISESDRQSKFFIAMLFLYAALLVSGCLVLLLARNLVNEYVGENVATFIILLFAGNTVYGGLTNGIKGVNAVHIKNWIDVLERIVRVAIQASLIAVGLSYLGLYAGYVVSIAVGLLASFVYLYSRTQVSLQAPSRREFQELLDFAKFSWLGRLKSQSVSWMDIFILGFFVSQSLVGVYQIAWTVSNTFGLLSKAISSNVFPEASGLTETGDRLDTLISEGLVYTGYVAIPGTVGAFLLGQRVLGIYGPEFRSGSLVLVTLSAAMVVRGYEQHLLRIINALDRPEITFRINLMFVCINMILNVVLIWRYDLIGAAVATLTSTTLSLSLAWYATNQIVGIKVSGREVLNQILAALCMGIVVIVLDTILPIGGFVELLALICIGVIVYFLITLLISVRIRRKVRLLIAEQLGSEKII